GWSSISSRGIGFVTMINLDELLSILRVGGAFYVDTQDKSTFTPFAFVLNVKRLKGDRAIELAPGCTLRRAKGSEISFIREWVAKYIGATSHDIWETRPPKSGTKSVKLPRNQWRYFVIEFSN